MNSIKHCLKTNSFGLATCFLAAAPKHAAQGAPAALLVLMPGAMLSPSDYTPLMQALQDHSGGDVALWVASPGVNWTQLAGMGFIDPTKWLEHSDAAIQAAVQAACDAGFSLQGSAQGRQENVFVAMHSLSSAFYPGVPMKHCAGSILLGAVLDGSTGILGDVVAAPRPVLHVLGSLDGQLRLPKAACTAAAAASLAAQYGARHLARVRPFAIVPGMNHAQFSSGVVNHARGDVDTDTPIQTTTDAVAGLVAAFIAANHSAADPASDSCRHAVDQLLQATTASFELLGPYCEAAGRPTPTALLNSNTAPPQDAAALYGYGAEVLGALNPSRPAIAHPGELVAAERFARHAQRAMLAAGMPAGADVDSVHVAVTVHTKLETFIYSQPTVFQAELPAGPQWVVHVHVHMFREFYQPGMDALLKPLSPIYFLKLKKGGTVALAMGLEGGSDNVVSAAELNGQTYQQALAAAPSLFADAFQQRGKHLWFGPDRDVSSAVRSPVEWMGMLPDLQPVPGEGPVLAHTTPCLSTPIAKMPAYDQGPGRFAGNHYIKCCSPAWMHEWIMIEGLRHRP